MVCIAIRPVAAVQAADQHLCFSDLPEFLVTGTLTLLREAFDEIVKEMHGIDPSKHCHFSMDVYITSEGSSATGDASNQAGISTPESTSTEGGFVKSPHSCHASTSSEELAEDVVQLPMMPQQAPPANEKGQEWFFSDGAEGRLVSVRSFKGRPAILTEALFGHLDEKSLRESRGLTVGLCGPPSLCDDVRFETVGLLKRGIHVDLVEDCFSW